MGSLPAASLVLNAAIAVLTVFAWLQLAIHADSKSSAAKLASRGVESLKYFTVLSNLFSCLTCVAYLVSCLIPSSVPTWLLALKLVSATSVMLTFLTVITVLRPKYGWKPLFEGGNLWMHLVLPLLAATDCILFTRVCSLPIWTTLFGCAPTALYGLFYLLAVIRNGPERDGKVYDFYGFLRWGFDKIPVVFVAMLACSWVIAALLYVGNLLCHL